MASVPVEYAVKYIQRLIPEEMLRLAFREIGYPNTLIGTPERLKNKVIRDIVLTDCNLIAGQECRIPVEKCQILTSGETFYVIKVPKELTNNKSIFSPLYTINMPYNLNTRNNLVNVAGSVQKLYNSNASTDMMSNTRLELLGENTILLDNCSYLDQFLTLVVSVANEPDLRNLNPRAYVNFGKLCLYATRSFIYNKLKIEVNRNALIAGVGLDVVKEILDEYRDSEDLYQEYLRTFQSILNMSRSDFTSQRITESISNFRF
jgi:hypothetical protein